MPEFDIDDCWNRIGERADKKIRCQRLTEFSLCRNCPHFIAAARLLLDRPLPDEYQAQLTEEYEQPLVRPAKHGKTAFVFRAGYEWLGLRASLINEVVNMGPIHSIPHKSSRIFRGIVNVRGRLEICVSVGGVLRLEPASQPPRAASPERLVVVVKGGRSVVFPVSEVLGPVQYEQDDILPLPITISGSKAVYTKGILHYDDKEIGLLDDVLLFRILIRNLA
jgi:chemotaxis-related protein WspD